MGWEFCSSRPVSGSSFNSRGRRGPLPVPLDGGHHVRVSKIWLGTAATTIDNGPKDAAGEGPRQGRGQSKGGEEERRTTQRAPRYVIVAVVLLLFASIRCTPMQTFSSRSLPTGARGTKQRRTPSPSPCPPTAPLPFSSSVVTLRHTHTRTSKGCHLPWPTCRSRSIDLLTTPPPISPRVPPPEQPNARPLFEA